MMIITNIKIFTDNCIFVPGYIIVSGSRIKEVHLQENCDPMAYRDDYMIDGQGCYCTPGLIDMHFHGCNGYDFCDGSMEAMREIAKYQCAVGVTSIAPATMTLPVAELKEILQTAYHFRQEQLAGKCSDEADLVGINMEGPFISYAKKGAQSVEHILPCNEQLYREMQRSAGGLIRVFGLAPEMSEETMTFIDRVKDEVIISLAHTDADYETAMAAIRAGASHITHLYNAMPPFLHRAPGVVGAAVAEDKVHAEIICDGIHVHPAVIKATYKMMGADRLILISDSMRAAGLGDGIYTLGGAAVTVTGNRATLVSDGSLAGSVTTLPTCIRSMVTEMGIPFETALRSATINPAKELEIFEQCGSITAGKKADLLLWNDDIKIISVIKNGQKGGLLFRP